MYPDLDRGLTHSHIRFVDRNMFMRYHGGGIGHVYMRKVEMKYENMTLKHTHGNSHPKPPCRSNMSNNNATSSGERPGAPSQPSAAGGLKPSGTDADDSDPDDEDYPPPRTSGTEYPTDCDEDSTCHNEGTSDINENTADHDHNEDSDDDSGSIDSNTDFDEVGLEDGYESFGLADL